MFGLVTAQALISAGTIITMYGFIILVAAAITALRNRMGKTSQR
jgi:hypothetical protein